jgi:hypothetical protein
MPHCTDVTGLAGIASATAASLLLLPGIANLAKRRLALALAAVFVLALFPIDGMPFAAYVRGVTGDLSITTLVLLWSVLLRPWCACVTAEPKERLALAGLIALAALTLYPMALGIGEYDPYRMGYGEPLFAGSLFLLAVAAWLGKFARIALCIALAAFAWSIGWYESNNIWDYLLDPFVSIYALFVITLGGARFIFQRDKSRMTRS